MTQEQDKDTPSDTFIEEKMKEFDERFVGNDKEWWKVVMQPLRRFLKSSLQEQLNQFKEMIIEYDEIYINEEVRQAINRMKWKLTDLLK